MFDRETGVLGSEHALDQHGKVTARGKFLDVGPREGGVDQVADAEKAEGAVLVHRPPADERVGDHVLGTDVPLADPQHRQVDGDHDRLIAVVDGRIEEPPRDASVPEDIELKPPIAVRGRGRDIGGHRGRK